VCFECFCLKYVPVILMLLLNLLQSKIYHGEINRSVRRWFAKSNIDKHDLVSEFIFYLCAISHSFMLCNLIEFSFSQVMFPTLDPPPTDVEGAVGHWVTVCLNLKAECFQYLDSMFGVEDVARWNIFNRMVKNIRTL